MHDIEEVERVQLYHCTKPIPDCGLGTDNQSQRQRVLIPPEGEFINPSWCASNMDSSDRTCEYQPKVNSITVSQYGLFR